jgi:hypothetical protein
MSAAYWPRPGSTRTHVRSALGGVPPEAVLHCDAAIHNGRPLPAPVRVLVLGAPVAWDELVAAAGPQWDAPSAPGS